METEGRKPSPPAGEEKKKGSDGKKSSDAASTLQAARTLRTRWADWSAASKSSLCCTVVNLSPREIESLKRPKSASLAPSTSMVSLSRVPKAPLPRSHSVLDENISSDEDEFDPRGSAN